METRYLVRGRYHLDKAFAYVVYGIGDAGEFPVETFGFDHYRRGFDPAWEHPLVKAERLRESLEAGDVRVDVPF